MVTSPKATRPAGVLTVSPANPTGTAQKTGRGRTPVEGQKVVLRRLPPGITEEETLALLGDEWKPGNGKVGWWSFHPGKISNDPSKPSRPSRAYLHLLRIEYIMPMVDYVRNTEWLDAKETMMDTSLVGPPVLEMSIYKKVPSAKVRADARQGTIDQDPEFMAFLEALANPNAQRDPEVDHAAEDEEKPAVKASSTPLIDYLREKKANKAKEASNAKSGKNSRHESQAGKVKASDDKNKSRDAKTDRARDRPRQNVKILTKKATTEAAAEVANAVASQIAASAKEDSSKGSRRAGMAAAARILARDLGISPGNAHRKVRQARQEAEKAESEVKAGGSKEAPIAKDAGNVAAVSATAESSSSAARTAAPKTAAGGSTRGSRGKKGAAATNGETVQEGREKKGRERNVATEKSGEASSTPKTPVAILKKKDGSASASGIVAPSSTTTTATALPPAVTTSAKAIPTGPKASQGKGSGGSGSQKKGGANSLSATATRAFVKHANPSQGVTEALLKEKMETFGGVTFVEIDRRKGFAYVDFTDHDSLAKAIAASPVSVAQATVQVLERKETKKAAPATNAGSAGNETGKGGSGSSAAAPTPKAASTAKAESSAGASVTTTPTGPAAEKASGEHKRGGRRRGGRGRGGGDGQSKEGSGSKASTGAAQGSGAASSSNQAPAT